MIYPQLEINDIGSGIEVIQPTVSTPPETQRKFHPYEEVSATYSGDTLLLSIDNFPTYRVLYADLTTNVVGADAQAVAENIMTVVNNDGGVLTVDIVGDYSVTSADHGKTLLIDTQGVAKTITFDSTAPLPLGFLCVVRFETNAAGSVVLGFTQASDVIGTKLETQFTAATVYLKHDGRWGADGPLTV